VVSPCQVSVAVFGFWSLAGIAWGGDSGRGIGCISSIGYLML